MESRRKVTNIALAILSFIILVFVTYLVIGIGRLENFDTLISEYILSFQSTTLTPIFIAITNIGSPLSLSFLSLFLFSFLFFKKRYCNSAFIVISMFIGVTLTTLLKWYVQMPRLPSGLVEEGGFSFPSGHATIATIFSLILVHIFGHRIKNYATRIVFKIFCFVAIFLVGISRIYLEVHRPNEVAAGFLLGILCVSISVIFCSYFCKKNFTEPSQAS